MHHSFLAKIPIELQQLIVTSLSKHDLLSLRQTCCHFNTVCAPYIVKEIANEMEISDAPELYLHKAVASCRHDLMECLLQHRPPLDRADAQGETALHVAVRKSCSSCVHTLLSSGANVSPISSQSWTPLMLASRYGHTSMASRLLEAGAAPNIQGYRGWTALHVSRRFGHDDLASLLESAGADCDVVDNDGGKAKETGGWTKCWGAL
ncbi:ankyrin repeat-containing domain protein [Thelonectria olida]|uniref:Ankyrin repeat-containing domain protein n=1 Tax=Thelonectria olida TaxID=1576542 RepID=A0A9P8VXA0_9HYPO|nr:ankyrin repeat-containing domain protein [Thelonectria olida]